MKSLTVEVELIRRVPDLYDDCTDSDFKDAIVEVYGYPGYWEVTSGVWKHSDKEIKDYVFKSKNNALAINEAANKAFGIWMADRVCVVEQGN